MSKIDKGPGNYRNKLSRSYRFKKKIGKIQNRTTDDSGKDEVKKARIVIRNLPFTTTEGDVRRLYEQFGELEEVKLLKRPDGKLVGCGFVQFTNIPDASKAIFQTNKTNLLGRTISCEWAIPKSEFYEKIKRNEEQTKVKDETEDTEVNNEDQSVEKSESNDDNYKHEKRKNSFPKKNALSKAEQRKLYKLKKRQKRSRIVIRNLPFTITEEILKDRFSKYGNLEEIKILTKPNGTPTGCCFLQFDRVQSAAQCIHHENLKSFQERTIVVDWAVPKDKFVKSNATTKTEQNEGDETIAIKDENDDTLDTSNISIKEEIDSDEDEIKEESEVDEEQKYEKSDSDENSNDSVDDNDDDNNDDDETIDDKKNFNLELDRESVSSSHPRRISNDVSEGKTVFIKNVPFSANNEDLKQCMEQFGPVYYALICMDSLTEHSKGTAFVKFRNVEDAEKCLAAGTELRIHDQVLDPHRALHRNEVNEKNKEKNKKIKDSRNLYLVKEGVILAASPAAEGVSASDMAKRLQLEQWKSQMLRNLNMFVSRVRLIIHNLPPNVDDAKLRQLFKNHSNPNAVITEARVMRDLKNVDANGIGKSKEHGFVSFTNHEDALKALRSINNNPNIFTKVKRPIVAFSIENRIMVNAKQKRIEKSRQRNPLWNNRKRTSEETNGNETNESEKPTRKKKNKSASVESGEANEEDVQSFAGTTGKPGINKVNGKFFIKKQATLHSENLKQQKKKAKNLKRLNMKKKEVALNRNEAKPKQGSKKPSADEANFNRLVNSYKNKLSSVSNIKSKWYET